MDTALRIPTAGALDFLSLGALIHCLDPGVVPFRNATCLTLHSPLCNSPSPLEGEGCAAGAG